MALHCSKTGFCDLAHELVYWFWKALFMSIS